MGKLAFAGILALTASTSFAQTDATTRNAGTAGPANLCRELVAFMKAAPPEPAPPPRTAEGRQKGGGSAQDDSGQGGPAHAAPDPTSKRSTETGANNAQQKSGLSAPVPAKPARTSKESVMSVAEAERLARANDIAACRDAGRKLRIAGVEMPSPLLALIALDLQYQQKKTAQ